MGNIARRAFLASAAAAVSMPLHGMSKARAIAGVPSGVPRVPPVTWFDDFLGKDLFPQYYVSAAPGGFHGPGGLDDPHIGGWWKFWTDNRTDAVVRMRLGEDALVSPYQALPFSAANNVIGQTRFKLNAAAPNLEVTLGFCGHKDPDNVIAFRLNPDNGWELQLRRDAEGVEIPTSWTHVPGMHYDLEIRATASRVEALIDGRVVAAGTTDIPTSGMCWEYQLWNKNNASVVMWTDYLHIRQDR